MSETRTRGGGSRFLYEPFDRASARLEAHERVTDERWIALERRLEQIETGLERLERRLWFAVFGCAAFLAADVATQFLTFKS
ncbi:GTA head formation protein, RCAP_rcc01685 family [Algicella marina]|uniref:Gene transfer agent protein n=1 Tax=Algicella marina TaxID=2683284 RepID=A0A6P1SY37_9RHOB|nr:hypothetical protein [Algicella marina]QHQ34550.1 hypothetical protein GO499_04765 [Algicella marina]